MYANQFLTFRIASFMFNFVSLDESIYKSIVDVHLQLIPCGVATFKIMGARFVVQEVSNCEKLKPVLLDC